MTIGFNKFQFYGKIIILTIVISFLGIFIYYHPRIKFDNAPIGVIYSDKINSGRLPYYHRLDVSLKRKFVLTKQSFFEVTAAVTNVYDRKNILVTRLPFALKQIFPGHSEV